jgi:glycosyltransferase involved in cell wall biosynthesis
MDAGTVSSFEPAVVLSQDMLSFEPGEMSRYAYSRSYWRLKLLKHIQVRSLRRAAGAVFLTDYAAALMQRYTGSLTNVAVIPHGIAESFRQLAIRDTWVEPPSRIECLYVSNVDLYKHQWQVVRAVAQLRRDNVPITLTLVGRRTGRAADLLERAIVQEKAADFVRVVDEVPHSAIPSYLAQADVFVFASSCENMPSTLVEAMASGLPIACSDRGPMPEVLRDGGTYFDPESAESIAAAIADLLKNPERRRKCAARARALAAKYSWARCADETWSFLADVARARASKRGAQVSVDVG